MYYEDKAGQWSSVTFPFTNDFIEYVSILNIEYETVVKEFFR